MLTEREIVKYLIKKLNLKASHLAYVIDCSITGVSKYITGPSEEKINLRFRDTIIEFFFTKHNIKKEIWNNKFNDIVELNEFLSEEKSSENILSKLLGKWYLYAHLSKCKEVNINSIYFWEIDIYSDYTFSFDRTNISFINQKEKGAVKIENDAVILTGFDKHTKKDFFSIFITRLDIKESIITGLMVGKNINLNLYHSSMILLSKDELDKNIISKVLNTSNNPTKVFDNLDTRHIRISNE